MKDNKKLIEFFIERICNADRRSTKARYVTVEDVEKWYGKIKHIEEV